MFTPKTNKSSRQTKSAAPNNKVGPWGLKSAPRYREKYTVLF